MAEVQLRHRFLLYIYEIKPVSNHLVGNWFLYPIRLFSPLRTSLICPGIFALKDVAENRLFVFFYVFQPVNGGF